MYSTYLYILHRTHLLTGNTPHHICHHSPPHKSDPHTQLLVPCHQPSQQNKPSYPSTVHPDICDTHSHSSGTGPNTHCAHSNMSQPYPAYILATTTHVTPNRSPIIPYHPYTTHHPRYIVHNNAHTTFPHATLIPHWTNFTPNLTCIL